MAVDYDQLPVSYTAVATYTASASKTVVTGYVTTAEYKGTVSKLNQGLTVYTAYFAGTEIAPEKIPAKIIEPKPEQAQTPGPENGPETGIETADDEADVKLLPFLILASAFFLLIGLGVAYYIPRIKKFKTHKGD
jgi:hypothetical protein